MDTEDIVPAAERIHYELKVVDARNLLATGDLSIRLAGIVYALAVEVERLQQQRTDLENRLAAVERRVGALEEPMP